MRRLVPVAATGLALAIPLSVLAADVAAAPAAARADRGRAIYAARCAACHGPDMRGIDDAPPLVGARFASTWGRQPPTALFSKIKLSMPQDRPGSLTPQEAADVQAAILEANRPAAR